MPKFRITKTATMKSPVFYTPLDVDEEVLRRLYPNLATDPQLAGKELAEDIGLLKNFYGVADGDVTSVDDPRGKGYADDFEWEVEYVGDDRDTADRLPWGPAVSIDEGKVAEAIHPGGRKEGREIGFIDGPGGWTICLYENECRAWIDCKSDYDKNILVGVWLGRNGPLAWQGQVTDAEKAWIEPFLRFALSAQKVEEVFEDYLRTLPPMEQIRMREVTVWEQTKGLDLPGEWFGLLAWSDSDEGPVPSWSMEGNSSTAFAARKSDPMPYLKLFDAAEAVASVAKGVMEEAGRDGFLWCGIHGSLSGDDVAPPFGLEEEARIVRELALAAGYNGSTSDK